MLCLQRKLLYESHINLNSGEKVKMLIIAGINNVTLAVTKCSGLKGI